ncbi:MAG TPA: hypothetical protein VND93_18360 [Myxococcales bacterium]|nr:hypothetical protein [Myxococcales bacterium]
MWTWKVALGVLGAAALVWFLLAMFVASRWPALHPALGRLRSSPIRFAVVGVLAAVVLGTVLLSRPASACEHRARAVEVARRRVERRLVIFAQPDRHLVIRALGHPDATAELTMLHMSACDHADVEAEADEARAEAIAEAQEAAQEAEEAAREAQQEARERAQEARQEAQERAQEAREQARERAEEARERAQEARDRAQEISDREMERAQAIMERMGSEMESARDAIEDGKGERRSRLGEILERQAERVERLGHTVAEQLRGLASRFGDDGDAEDEDDDVSVDL